MRHSHVSLEEQAAAELSALASGPREGAWVGNISLRDLWGVIGRVEQMVLDAELFASPAVNSLLIQAGKRDSLFRPSDGPTRVDRQGGFYAVFTRGGGHWFCVVLLWNSCRGGLRRV